jgi:hypothetical protein
VLIAGGSVVLTLDSSVSVGGQQVSDDHWAADFDDTDASAPYTVLICACAGGGGGGGMYRTADNGTSWDRWWHNNYNGGGITFQSSYCTSVQYFTTTRFLVGKDPSLVGGGTPGSACLTSDGTTTWDEYTAGNGLAANNCRRIALCDQVTGGSSGPSHWMAAHPGGGIDVTTNGDAGTGTTTFTAYDTTTTPALLSDTVHSVVYWNGNGATGVDWMIGTAEGLMITSNGGGNLADLRSFHTINVCTGYVRIDVTETLNGQTITYDILDGTGTPIPSYSGLTPSSGSIDISGINYATYPVIRIRVNLSTTNASQTPVLHDITIIFQY